MNKMRTLLTCLALGVKRKAGVGRCARGQKLPESTSAFQAMREF
jgi:hypothetical protein